MYVLKTSWRYLCYTSWRRLEDVLKTFWRLLEDVLKTFLPDVLNTFFVFLFRRRLEDVFWRRKAKANTFVLIKTSSEDEDERYLQDVFIKTNVCWDQRINNSSSFRSLVTVICFATAPVSIFAVFVRPHQYLFTILESGNIIINSLAAWSAVLKGRLCSSRKPEKGSSAFATFWF